MCPRCGEDRPTLITEVIDPMGRRFYCCMCAFEFKPVKETARILSPEKLRPAVR